MLPLINASDEVHHWLDVYWAKLNLPDHERRRLAITQDRREFARWTGRRLNPMALGCYCFLPGSPEESSAQVNRVQATSEAQYSPDVMTQLSLFDSASAPPRKVSSPSAGMRHRHLIFIEPDLLELGTEVTVAHELIHLSDRVRGRPRKHHCHGHDAIAVDEAAVTGRDPDLLRALLRDETARREATLRVSRPFKYVYACPHCKKQYLRTKRYPRPVSCGVCARTYNPDFLLVLHEELEASEAVPIL